MSIASLSRPTTKPVWNKFLGRAIECLNASKGQTGKLDGNLSSCEYYDDYELDSRKFTWLVNFNNFGRDELAAVVDQVRVMRPPAKLKIDLC